MQINSNPVPQMPNPAFKSVKLYSGADRALKNVLTRKEWIEFEKIIDERAKDACVDMLLYAKSNGKKLEGRIVPKEMGLLTENFRVKDYSQRFFESMMSFIERMNKCAMVAEKDISSQPVVDVDKIISKTK